MISKVYLDMDEVLVDFLGGADAVLASHLYPPFESDFWNSIRGSREFRWKLIKQTPCFWESLDFLPSGKKLWKLIQPLKPALLSAVCDLMPEECRKGKLKWIERNLPDHTGEVHLVDRSEKANFAKSNALLIDDYQQNCDEFIASGGNAIRCRTLEQTISDLKSYGFSLS